MERNIKRSLMVTPAEPTWSGVQPLSELDLIGCTTHAHVVYFYQQTTTPFQAIIETLEDSLARALVHFYPLAGRLRSIGKDRFELVCNGKGVVFVVAELMNTQLVDFGEDFTPSPELEPFLFPSIDESVKNIEELPISFIQVTKFGCGGTSISLATSHLVTDGLSAANFMMVWAKLARGETLQTVPFLDKKVLRAGEPPEAAPHSDMDHSKDFCCLPFLLKQPSAEELKKMKTRMITLRLTKEQVEKLKNMANQDRHMMINLNHSSKDFTRYEAIAAHIWKCSSLARKHEENQTTAFLVTLDSRNRLQPPLPSTYFGNAVFDVKTSCMAGELMSKPLTYGASKIRSAIEKVKNDYVFSAIDYLKRQQDLTQFQYSFVSSKNGGGNMLGNPNTGMVNWVNLSMNGIDFGWGKEIHFGPGYHEVDGDSWLLRGRDGDGSLNILLCLLEDHVEAFKIHFYEDLSS